MNVIILAAGRGTRMKIDKPKVLVDVEGVPIISRIVSNLDIESINKKIVVVGENKELIQNILKEEVVYAYQMIPIGTLDALVQALPYVDSKEILVIPGDIPYISEKLINDIIKYYYQTHSRNLIIGMKLYDPSGYGRMIFDNGTFEIIEEKNIRLKSSKTNVVNTGVYILNVDDIYPYLTVSKKDEITGEYYLTDYINHLADKKIINDLIFPETYLLKGANDIESLKKILIHKNNSVHLRK